MKRSGKFLRETLELVTQCVLLPGVELRLDDLLSFYGQNIKGIIGRKSHAH